LLKKVAEEQLTAKEISELKRIGEILKSSYDQIYQYDSEYDKLLEGDKTGLSGERDIYMESQGEPISKSEDALNLQQEIGRKIGTLKTVKRTVQNKAAINSGNTFVSGSQNLAIQSVEKIKTLSLHSKLEPAVSKQSRENPKLFSDPLTKSSSHEESTKGVLLEENFPGNNSSHPKHSSAEQQLQSTFASLSDKLNIVHHSSNLVKTSKTNLQENKALDHSNESPTNAHARTRQRTKSSAAIEPKSVIIHKAPNLVQSSETNLRSNETSNHVTGDPKKYRLRFSWRTQSFIKRISQKSRGAGDNFVASTPIRIISTITTPIKQPIHENSLNKVHNRTCTKESASSSHWQSNKHRTTTVESLSYHCFHSSHLASNSITTVPPDIRHSIHSHVDWAVS